MTSFGRAVSAWKPWLVIDSLRRSSRRPLQLAVLALAFAPSGDIAFGELVQFEVNPTLSTLNLVPATFQSFFVTSGTQFYDTVGVIRQNQNPESLKSHLSGVLVGDLVGGTLSLESQSLLVALANPAGPFIPSPSETGSPGQIDVFGGDAVSNFGGFFTEAYVAVRDIEVNVASGALVINAPASSMAFDLTSGIIDVRSTGSPPEVGFIDLPEVIAEPVDNASSQPITGSFEGTIQIPFSVEYIFDYVEPGDPPFVIEDAGRVNLQGVIVATRASTAIPGNFNGDQVVDGADLARWRSSFGANPDSDADADGDSDGADFLIWQRNSGRTSAISAVANVPESSTACLAALAAAFGAAWRFSRRHN